MAGIIATETPDDQSVYAPGGYTRIQRSWIDGFSTQVGADIKYNPVPSGIRWADRQWGNEDSPTLSVEDANAKYGIPNVVSFDEPVPEATAKERYDRARDDARRASIIDRSGLGWMGRLTAGFIAGALDPVNIGLSVAPELLLGRVGLGVGAASSVAERAAFYGATGATGGAWTAPINAYLASSDARSYTTGDILADITLGAAIGTVAPIAGAGLMRLIRGKRAPVIAPETSTVAAMHASPEVRLETLSTSLRQIMTGLPVDVAQSVNTVSYTTDVIRQATNALTTATERAAITLERSTGGISAAQARRAGLEPLGETGSEARDLRTLIQWQPSKAGTVAASDLRNIPNIVTRMTPVEETPQGAMWRTVRGSDNRVVETRLTTGKDKDGKPFERYTQQIVPRDKRPLSKFIDTDVGDISATYPHNMWDVNEAPIDVQGPGLQSTPSISRQMELTTPLSDTVPSPQRADPQQIADTLKQFRPGETAPYPAPTATSVTPSVIPVDAANDLATLEAQLAANKTPAAAPDAVIGEATPDIREIDAINAEQDEMIRMLKSVGALDKTDLDYIEQAVVNETYFKEVAKVRAAAVECLITNAAEAANG